MNYSIVNKILLAARVAKKLKTRKRKSAKSPLKKHKVKQMTPTHTLQNSWNELYVCAIKLLHKKK